MATETPIRETPVRETAPVAPRETMRDLPRPLQPFLTWVTGMPPARTELRVRRRPGMSLLAGALQTGLAMAAGAWALGQAWYVLVPVLLLVWPAAAGGMRRLDVVVVHQTLHRMFTESKPGNRIVCELITTLLWRSPYDPNKQEHLTHHAFPCSLKDGDVHYLRSTGVRAGMTRREFRRFLLRAVLSPRHHGTFLGNRLRENFARRAPAYRIVMAYGYAAGTAALLAVTGWWLEWLLLWVVPATFFFQNQTFVYTLSEHRWWLFGNAERLTRTQRDQLTFGRFCGRPAPDTAALGRGRALAAWSGWWLRMVALYAPYRLCVLVGDTVQHDLHHVRPKCDWANSAWVRSEDIEAGNADRYSEAWGGLLTHVYTGNAVREPAPGPVRVRERELVTDGVGA
jgi:fatty acid desaturase